MTTTVTTITKSAEVFTRTWNDLDPKVRNALYVWALAVLGALGGLAVGRLTLPQAATILAPVTLAVAVAYATTSKHKKVIRDVVDDSDQLVHDLAPIVKELAPQAAAAVDVAVGGIDALTAALTPEQTDLTAATAAASDPAPTTAQIAAVAAVAPTAL